MAQVLNKAKKMNKVILCVDDERIILNSLKYQLRNNFGSKFKYEFAENAIEAMEIIDDLYEEGMIEIIIVSDWSMPKMNGDDFLIEVHKKYPKMLKILLTGQADNNAIKNAENNAGLYTCIQKPWSEGVLIDTIKLGLEAERRI